MSLGDLPELHVPPTLLLELPAIVAGSLSGGGHAVAKKLDGVGVVALAIATGLGGGIIRDVLLSTGPPLALTQSAYLVTAFIGAVAAFFFSGYLARARPLLKIIDALALGIFATAGAERALDVGVHVPGALLVGVL